ncbi:MAG: prephenate dehydratase [Bacillaceae bacterium]
MKIGTLGPKGTFSELATMKYMSKKEITGDITLFPTITRVFHATVEDCDISIIPIENLLDGFVHGALDLLVKSELKIIGELVVPVQFSFIGNGKNLEDITHIYAQFKTQGQCCDFLEPYEPIVITTESNGTSFEKVKMGMENIGAVVPAHMIEGNTFDLVIPQVTDSTENETRFIVLGREESTYNAEEKYKTSIVVTSVSDRPGLLSHILGTFSNYQINLTSIISRPTKTVLGSYYFFIDFEGHHVEDEKVRLAIQQIQLENDVKILGSYTFIS